MKRFSLKDVRLDEKELNTDLGSGNFIFVGSGTDMFANNVSEEWIEKVLEYCKKFDNKYLFQSKNPIKFLLYKFPENSVFGTTIESNRDYPEIMNNSPQILGRKVRMRQLRKTKMVTIEPILDFDLEEFVKMIKSIQPSWVNIGADSKGHKLPEPGKEKIQALIDELSTFTMVKIKTNLNRLMK